MDIIERLRNYAHDNLQWWASPMAEAANEIERLESIVQLAIDMRSAQRTYFKNKSKESLIEAKSAESSFDKAALEYVTGKDNGHR